MDIQTVGIIVAVVAVVMTMLYVMDRRSKQAPIEVADAAKLALGASTIAGGVAYAVAGADDAVGSVVEAVTETTQEMFVGKPDF
jgi:hypothetical protein